MGYYFGITLKITSYKDVQESLQIYSQLYNKQLRMVILADLDLLDLHLQFVDKSTIDRIVLYSYEELGSWENLKKFSQYCQKHNLEWGIVKEDLYSDLDTPINYLTNVL